MANQYHELNMIAYVMLVIGLIYTAYSKINDYKRFKKDLEETGMNIRREDRNLFVVGSCTLILIMLGFMYLYWSQELIYPPYLFMAAMCFVIPDMVFTRWFSKLKHNYEVVASWIIQIQFKMKLIHLCEDSLPESEKEKLVNLAHEYLQKGHDASGLWDNYLLLGIVEQIKDYEKTNFLKKMVVELAKSDRENKSFIENKKY